MLATRRRDTRPELELRSAIHRLGLRYFVHRRPLGELRREADIVFPRSCVAVFVDSCFWHGCPDHVTWPVENGEWWRAKIESNRARDRDTDDRLYEQGWTSVRVWTHESAVEAAARIAEIVRAQMSANDS